MPSVPLMSARPSFSTNSTGSMPAWAIAAPPSPHPCVGKHLALADHHQRHVGQRRQVSAGAEGAILRDDRDQTGVDHPHQRLGHQRPRTRRAQGQSPRSQEHHGPDHLGLHGRSHPRRVGADHGTLERGPPIGGNRLRGQRSEAGGDAVGGFAPRHVFDDPAGDGHPLDGVIAETHLLPPARNRNDVGDSHAGAPEFHNHELTGFRPGLAESDGDFRSDGDSTEVTEPGSEVDRCRWLEGVAGDGGP